VDKKRRNLIQSSLGKLCSLVLDSTTVEINLRILKY